MARQIEIDQMITVGALAELLLVPVTKLIAELMKNGVLATINEKIDFETAQIIVGELGLEEIELVPKQAADAAEESHTRRKERSQGDEKRPPIVAVMGHVDHGKTSLLDKIRSASVVKGEAGGITQHISAYQVDHGDRSITFLDTPGHEAFAALREHGALLTDLVIIVVAADDGVKPQTIEAIRFAKKAGVKILVAINKMDKPEANPDRVKQQLAEHELMIEQYGGDIIALPVSAKTGEGVDALLDMVLLVADVEELNADFKASPTGLVIESHMETGRGPVAEVLVEQGTLQPGQFIVAGNSYGKIRNLESTFGKAIKEATPSTPAIITGFKNLPEFGDEFYTVASEKAARLAIEGKEANKATGAYTNLSGGELLRIISRNTQLSERTIIVKADVQGSLTSVVNSLKSLDNDEVAVRVVGSGVGNISENDVHLAATSGAIIYGFHVGLPTGVKQLASRDRVQVRLYKVIYELIDDVKLELTKLLKPEVIETVVGSLVVKGVFKTTKTEVICGGEVTKGKLYAPLLVRVRRGDEVIAEAEATGLKRGPQEAKEVVEGEMCGVSLKTTNKVDLVEGDRLEFYTRELKERTL